MSFFFFEVFRCRCKKLFGVGLKKLAHNGIKMLVRYQQFFSKIYIFQKLKDLSENTIQVKVRLLLKLHIV